MNSLATKIECIVRDTTDDSKTDGETLDEIMEVIDIYKEAYDEGYRHGETFGRSQGTGKPYCASEGLGKLVNERWRERTLTTEGI